MRATSTSTTLAAPEGGRKTGEGAIFLRADGTIDFTTILVSHDRTDQSDALSRFLYRRERLTKNILAIFTDVLLRFALAEDETGEAWVIPDTNAVYPGRGMRVLPSYAALEICAQAGSFTHSFKRNHVRLPLGIEGARYSSSL